MYKSEQNNRGLLRQRPLKIIKNKRLQKQWELLHKHD